jgi:hypothetical protein
MLAFLFTISLNDAFAKSVNIFVLESVVWETSASSKSYHSSRLPLRVV